MTIHKFILSLTLSCGLSSLAHAQIATDTMPLPYCPQGSVIIVDGLEECRIDDTLQALIDDVEALSVTGDPISAGNEGDRKALRKMPDVSPEQLKIGFDKYRQFKGRHDALAQKPMSSEEKLNYDLLGFVIDQRLLLADFDEARIPFTNDSGFFNEMSYISRQTTFETADDFEAYAARLHAFYAPFKTMPDSIDSREQKRLRALGKAALDMAVLPAYRDLAEFLKKNYIPHARKTVGIGTSEEGRAYYEALTRYFTTLDLTPDEVHNIGLAEVKRIRREMDTIIKEVKFDGTFDDFLDFLRTDPQFYAESEEDILKEAAWLAKQIDGKMPEFFGTLPRLSYGVIPVPAEIAANYTTGRYWNGNPQQGRAGNYVVNTSNLPNRPLYNLPALTAHEGVPGHHHQISLAQELKDVPKFRKSLYPNAFGEGWGLYSEKLVKEMGLYKTPYDNFGRLTYEMWRACRLVVDTGMHYKGWTRDQAEACFYENSALAPHNIRSSFGL